MFCEHGKDCIFGPHYKEMVYQLSEHTESSLSEGVELLLVCRQTKPHIDSNLNRHLLALGTVHRVLRKQKQTKYG